MEGGHAIENSLGALRAYYDLGVRYMTLTHNVTLDWADAATDAARHGGLTPFGEEVVREMNRLGMLVDLSHVSPGTMSDALDVDRGAGDLLALVGARASPTIRATCPTRSSRRLPTNGGVVMVTFVPAFISQAAYDRQTPARRGDRARCARRVGARHRRAARARSRAWRARAPGAARDARAGRRPHRPRAQGRRRRPRRHRRRLRRHPRDCPSGLEDVSHAIPALFAELARRGWTDADLAKLAGGNVLRALRRAEIVVGAPAEGAAAVDRDDQGNGRHRPALSRVVVLSAAKDLLVEGLMA